MNQPMNEAETYPSITARTATGLLCAVLRRHDGDVVCAFETLRGPLRTHECARSASRILSRTARKRGVTHVDYVGNYSFQARPPQMALVGLNERYELLFDRAIEGSMTDEQIKAEFEQERASTYPALTLLRLVNAKRNTVAIYPRGGGVPGPPREPALTTVPFSTSTPHAAPS
jgi:hypothetical protein